MPLFAGTTKHFIQRDEPTEPADLRAEAVGPQQVAHPPARADDPQRNALRSKLAMQLVQHAAGREIDVG